MAKRFVDSEIFKSPSIRALKAPYKLLWLYLVNDCDNAGVWVVDFDIAAIYLDRVYKAEEALKEMGDKVKVIDGGKRWYLPDFVSFQYGELNPDNRAHKSVIDKLEKYKISPNKPLTRPSQGRKDMDKELDKDKEKRASKAKPKNSSEVEEYCQQLGLPTSDGQYMFDHWEGNGYTNGGKPVKDWKATIRSWKTARHLPSLKDGMNKPKDPPSPPPYPERWKPIMMNYLHEKEPELVERFEGINHPRELPFTLSKAIFGR